MEKVNRKGLVMYLDVRIMPSQGMGVVEKSFFETLSAVFEINFVCRELLK
jgi:hypothetical protein